MKKLAIIGASYLQRPLVMKAKEIGIETHVFAWQEGNVVDDISDYYYPISILEKEKILEKCRVIKIDGITSIASDIAMPTVNYVANMMDLVANSLEATRISTDKFQMRKALKKAGVPCPKFLFFDQPNYKASQALKFPLIVKPTDRSGSRGVTKVLHSSEVNKAIKKALDNSINGKVIVEEFIDGREFSVEMISWKGFHYHLAITDKVTTGAPYFVEIEHHQPADITEEVQSKIVKVVKNGLSVLGIENGASHSEVFLTPDGDIRIVEIAGRMGGELIGSHVVPLSIGYDFVKGVIEVALDEFVAVDENDFKNAYSGVYYALPESGTIERIVDHSEDFNDIVCAIPLLEEGNKVEPVIDGAGKRAGLVLYSHPSHKVRIEPLNVLEFKIS